MSLDAAVADLVRGRRSVYKNIDRYHEFDIPRVFRTYTDFYDTVVNGPLVDITGLTLSEDDDIILPISGNGLFDLPADSFATYRAYPRTPQRDATGDVKSVFLHFQRMPCAEVINMVGETRAITDAVCCAGVIVTAEHAGKPEFHPLMPLAVCSEKDADGEYGVTSGLLHFIGESPYDLVPQDAVTSVVTALLMAMMYVKDDKSRLIVPSVRRSVHQVAKGKH